MTKEEAIMIIGNIPINPLTVDECYSISQYQEAKTIAIEALKNISKLSNELTSFREGITDENVLIGFNMAIAICNKHLGE